MRLDDDLSRDAIGGFNVEADGQEKDRVADTLGFDGQWNYWEVAAVSGDARCALEICRRAAELADYRAKALLQSGSGAAGKVTVGMVDVDAAIKEMFQAPHIQVIRSSSKLSKIFLAAMVHKLYKTGMGETTFEKLATTVSCFCSSNGEMFQGYDTLMRVRCRPGECRILLCEDGSRHKV